MFNIFTRTQTYYLEKIWRYIRFGLKRHLLVLFIILLIVSNLFAYIWIIYIPNGEVRAFKVVSLACPDKIIAVEFVRFSLESFGSLKFICLDK